MLKIKVDLEENATFLGGHRKSGTTMLLTLLEGHPELCVYPPDSGFFYAYFPKYDSSEYTNEDRVNRIIDFCYKNLEIEINNVDKKNELKFPYQEMFSNFKRRTSKGNYTPKEMLLAMISAYYDVYSSKQENASYKRWVEKTTSSEIYANYIFKWFPKAKFIHLIRDPRDNYASLKSGWDSYYHKRSKDQRELMQSLIDRGKLGLKLAKYNKRRYGDDRYLVVKFETLTTKPQETMAQICEFLDIKYDNSLFRTSICGLPWRGNNFEGLEFLTASSVNVNRWRERITENEAKLIEFHFREIMKYFNYELVYDINECIDVAVEHYKWYNYAQFIKV